MASSNINKIVQTNFNLKPWVLSKNTSEIVNTCIQKIYKQMPNNFRKGLKTPKVAAPRQENLGPIRSYKNEERLRPIARLTAISQQQAPATKTSKSNAMRQKETNLVKNVKASTGNNMQIANKIAGVSLTPSKKLLKSPNYKIYKSRRFGSSANSSRSSIYRRNDERKRQRLHYQPQVNYLARSFNNSQFEGTYARYLMPLRNQHVETRVGSIKHAKRINVDIQHDLMKIDTLTRGRISLVNNTNPTNDQEVQDRLNVWNHPPSLDLYSKPETPKNNMSMSIEIRKLPRLSPENRNAMKGYSGRPSQFKQAAPPNEQMPTKLDHNRTEMYEKHRRNRMRKLGLMEESPAPTEADVEVTKTTTTEAAKPMDQNNVSCEFKSKWTPNIASHMEAKAMVENASPTRTYSSKFQSRLAPPIATQTMRHTEDKPQRAPVPLPPSLNTVSKIPTKSHFGVRLDKNEPTTKTSLPLSDEVSAPTTSSLNISYTSTGPAATARAQLTNHNSSSFSSHRYNRDDFFSPRRY